MIGILLVNLGTPDGPEPRHVRPYLKQFLSDPYVIDIPAPARWALVNLLILPTRPAKTSEAYEKIWSERGSPLLYHTLDLGQRVQIGLGERFQVRVAMRYGNPSMQAAMEDLRARAPERILVVPLYPQYSLAATESSIAEFLRLKQELGLTMPHEIIRDFYDDPRFIEAFADVIDRSLFDKRVDFHLFSFHGLPERQVRKTDPSGKHCLPLSCPASDPAYGSCCATIGDVNRWCYRAQSLATARAIAERLGLERDRYAVSFQSRLGRTPWIRPYTDVIYDELAAKGIRRLAVISPSFVADCLETLEEIQIRGRDQFRAAGGEELYLVPSLNSELIWSDALRQMILERVDGA